MADPYKGCNGFKRFAHPDQKAEVVISVFK